jgi:hypothetical protein
MARRLLGTHGSLSDRTRVYLADGAVEIDEIEGYSGTRRRVLFDEVLLVTLDRRRRVATIALGLGLAMMVSTPMLIAIFAEKFDRGLAIAWAILVSPFLLWCALHLALGVDYLTVFGKRTSAQMTFSLRKGRARAAFEQLRERVGDAQELERKGVASRAASGVPVPPDGAAGAA